MASVLDCSFACGVPGVVSREVGMLAGVLRHGVLPNCSDPPHHSSVDMTPKEVNDRHGGVIKSNAAPQPMHVNAKQFSLRGAAGRWKSFIVSCDYTFTPAALFARSSIQGSDT